MSAPTTATCSLDDYRVLSKIGEGTFGSVHKIERKKDKKIMVWKELSYAAMKEKEREQLVAEVNILRDLKHTHIVGFYDRIIDRENKKIYIVMEYCSGGDIAAIIKEHQRKKTYVEEEFIWKVLNEITSALALCHKFSTGVVLHRDLKPANIFLDNSINKTVKLGDFGLARTLTKLTDFAQTRVGTPFYMSPEQILQQPYNDKSDIWSLGCSMYELAALSPPFKATTENELSTKIRAGRFDRIPKHYSNELEQLIRSMIQVDQSKRPSITQIIQLLNERSKRREEVVRPMTSGNVNDQPLSARGRLDQETNLARREAALMARESLLDARERRLNEKEAQLKQRELALLTNIPKSTATYRLPLTNLSNFPYPQR